MRRLSVMGLVASIIVLILVSPALCVESGGGGEQPVDINSFPPSYAAPPEYISPPEYIDKQYTPFADQSASKVQNHDNGIVIGQPKLFELRSLQMMIDNVKAALVQTSYPDVSQLFGMTGRIQGVQSSSSSQAIEMTVPPGGPAREGSVPKPTIPNLSSPSDFESRSSLSLSPTDALAEQTSLWHQLVNLQMLLDGALSDRLIPVDADGAATTFGNSVKLSPRAQAIVGFQISVDPRQDYRNAVAEAMITIDNKVTSIFDLGGYGDEPSLMMLLPRSQTYNTVSINRDSKSFGFGTVVNVLQFGSAQEKRKENYYIGKDTDTVALEKIPGLPPYGLEKTQSSGQSPRYRGVSFGWQFRPVFTRASVEPGIRQVFAMLSLPASVSQEKWEGKVRVTTYWRRFDRGTGAVGKPIDGTVNEWVLDDLVVPIGSGVEEALKPNITKAQWEDAGGGNVAVTLEGSNFSLGTDIACGETSLNGNSVSLLSDKRIRFIAPASTVARGDITLIERYGVANLRRSAGDKDDPYKGIEASSSQLTQQDDQTTAVELTLSNVKSPERLLTDRRPVVQIDGQLFGIGDKTFTSISANESQQTVTIKFLAPTRALMKAKELVVRDLIGPATIPAACRTGDENCIAHEAVVLSTGDNVSVAILGRGFRQDVQVQVGSSMITDLRLNSLDGQATVITFDIDKDTAYNTKYILLMQGKQPPMLVPFSMPPPPGN